MMTVAVCQIADCRAEVLVLLYRTTEWSAFDWTTCWGILTAILVLVLVWFEWKLVQSGLRWWNQDNPAEAEVEYPDIEQGGRDEDTVCASPVRVEQYYISSDSSDAPCSSDSASHSRSRLTTALNQMVFFLIGDDEFVVFFVRRRRFRFLFNKNTKSSSSG